MVTDPRCPECGDPVGGTARYCMHCDAEFDAPVAGDSDERPRTEDDAADDGERTVGTGSVAADLTTWERRLSRWLGPDGWIDNSLTVVVAVVAGAVLGPLTTVVSVGLTGSLWSVAAGLVVLVGATAALANRRTVYGAVRGGCFAVAGLLALLPVSLLVGTSDRPLGRLDVFLASEFAVGLVAVPLVLVGVLAGRLRTKVVG